MSPPDPDPELPVHSRMLSRVRSRLRTEWRRKVFRDFGGAMFWQGLGKLVQIVGTAYAARCLGATNLGLSGTVIVVATNAQLVLDLGLDIVAVRHVAAGTARLADIAAALFTLRLFLAVAAAAVWLVAVSVLPMGGQTRWVWTLGVPFLVTLVMNFSWCFQATERLPRLALIQTIISIGVSAYYLTAFHPHQSAGSDLLVLVLINGLAGAVVWWRIQRANGFPLLAMRHLSHAGRLIREARPNWLFNLSYYVIATMGLPLIYLLSNDERQSGLDRSAFILATSLQTFLQYFSIVMIPRIVVWRKFERARFRRRILAVIIGVCGLGLVSALGIGLLQRPLYHLIYGREFMSAAGLLPILILAKFFSTITAISVWALFAERRDWLAVKCCLGPLAVELILHFLLIPTYGMIAAAWLNCGAEACLATVCVLVFWYITSHPKSQSEESSLKSELRRRPSD